MLHSDLIRPPSRICKPRIIVGEDCGAPETYCSQWSAQYIEESIKGCYTTIHKMCSCLADNGVDVMPKLFPDNWADPNPVVVAQLPEDWQRTMVSSIVREAQRILVMYKEQEFRKVSH